MATETQLRPLLRPWLAALRQRSEATARGYDVAVTRFLHGLGDGELDPDAIADYLESLADSGLTAGSQAMYISAVRSFLKVAQSQGLVDKSPREFLIRPRVGITSYGRYLDLEELRRLIGAATGLSPTHRATVLLLWSTGLRVSEAAGARWLDVFKDPAGRVGLRVVHGKGGKERIVALVPETLSALAAIRKGEHAGSEELDAADKSLPSITERRAYTAWSLWRLVKDASRRRASRRTRAPTG
jgi:site-specific recombinase XerD